MGDRIRERVGGTRAFWRGECRGLILCVLVLTFCAGAVLAEDVKVPAAWTSETKQVKVATPSGEETKTITYYTNSIGVKLVLIPAGEFVMGSPASEELRDSNESPQHKVRVSKPFFIGAYELTQKQYASIMGMIEPRFQGDDNPMEKVAWDDAVAFFKMLSQREGVTYRLPTEAEWEYACRAGSTTPFYFGATISANQANYNATGVQENASAPTGKTMPVGSFPPNAFGLYDMHGNVFEWCQDWYGDDYYANSPPEDPKGPDRGDTKMLRGGAWNVKSFDLRSAAREWATTATRYGMIGFRVVVETPQ
jgi:formylglycine-generating enzyme required for sulfatase activity